MEKAVDQALSNLGNFRRAANLMNKPLADLKILEFGPGIDFGAQLLIASEGASVILADPYLAKWDEDFHPQFYSMLASRYDGPKSQLDAVIAAGGYGPSSIMLLEQPAEKLSSVKSETVDLICSFAVLEHVFDIAAVSEEMARVSAPGAAGLHIIDLRDHRDFGRPLEHLIASDEHHAMLANSVSFEFGNRVRSSEFAAHFERAGFGIRELRCHDFVDPSYLDQVAARLQNSTSSYRFWPKNDLSRIVVEFTIEKLDQKKSSYYRLAAASDQLDMITALKSAAQSSANHTLDAEPIPLSPEDFRLEQGHAWLYFGQDLPEGDSVEYPTGSSLRLFENGIELGPAHALHADIRSIGNGRFSHWGRTLMFSASDNTNPAANGRSYRLCRA